MADTTIEWTDKVWNPVTGCSKVSQGCKNCYAERVFPRAYWPRKFTDVLVHPDRLSEPLHWKKPCRIFVNSMSDLFHEAIPDEFIDKVFSVMALSEQHIFQVLTKRPERMREYCTGLTLDRIDMNQPTWMSLPRLRTLLFNVHLGVSVEDQETFDERTALLLQTPAAVWFISYEPALGPIHKNAIRARLSEGDFRGIDWVICGGESGPNARPMHPDWARSMRDQCQAAGVPFFFKQWGEWVPKRFYVESGRNYPWGVIDVQGRRFDRTTPWNGKEGEDSDAHEYTMLRVGKKAAGAMLDGRAWKEFPK